MAKGNRKNGMTFVGADISEEMRAWIEDYAKRKAAELNLQRYTQSDVVRAALLALMNADTAKAND